MVARSCRGCGTVLKSGATVCEACTELRERKRGTRRQRGYGGEYERNRAIVVELAWTRGESCVLCGRGFSSRAEITAEHLTPVRAGGSSDLDNLGPAHASCNFGWARKSAPR